MRCKQCGCVTHWVAAKNPGSSRMGVNMRNADPDLEGRARSPSRRSADVEVPRLRSAGKVKMASRRDLHTYRTDRTLCIMTKNRTYGAEEARAHLPELLERAHRGEVTAITKHGRPLAKVVPVDAIQGGKAKMPLLSLAGSGRVFGDGTHAAH